MSKTFTSEDVEKLLPNFRVYDEPEGVRIRRDPDDYNADEPVVGPIMAAAFELELSADQFLDNSKYQHAMYGSTWTGCYQEAGIDFDILFLHPTV